MHSLPGSGGLFDQDCYLVEAMTLCLYYNQVKEQQEIDKMNKQNK